MEAFHYKYHPAVQYVKNLIDSGHIGTREYHTCRYVDAWLWHVSFSGNVMCVEYRIFDLKGGYDRSLTCNYLGVVKSVSASMNLPLWLYKIEFGPNDIRFNYDLAGTSRALPSLVTSITLFYQFYLPSCHRRNYHGRRLLHDQRHEVTLQQFFSVSMPN